jgi:hypothetical protein
MQDHHISGFEMRDLPGGMDDWKLLGSFGRFDSSRRYQRLEGIKIVRDRVRDQNRFLRPLTRLQDDPANYGVLKV